MPCGNGRGEASSIFVPSGRARVSMWCDTDPAERVMLLVLLVGLVSEGVTPVCISLGGVGFVPLFSVGSGVTCGSFFPDVTPTNGAV